MRRRSSPNEFTLILPANSSVTASGAVIFPAIVRPHPPMKHQQNQDAPIQSRYARADRHSGEELKIRCRIATARAMVTACVRSDASSFARIFCDVHFYGAAGRAER